MWEYTLNHLTEYQVREFSELLIKSANEFYTLKSGEAEYYYAMCREEGQDRFAREQDSNGLPATLIVAWCPETSSLGIVNWNGTEPEDTWVDAETLKAGLEAYWGGIREYRTSEEA